MSDKNTNPAPDVTIKGDHALAVLSALELAKDRDAFSDEESDQVGLIFQALLASIPTDYLREKVGVPEEKPQIIVPDNTIIMP